MIIKVAWRNVWRHKTRSAVIVFSVMFGIWAGIFMQSFMNGMVEQRVRTSIQTEVSHLQIHNPGFSKDHDANYFIPDGPAFVKTISGFPQVQSVCGRVIAKGMIATSSGSAGIKINGIEPAAERSTTQLDKSLIEGNYLSTEGKNEIFIGEKLLKKLKLKLKSKVVLTVMDKDNNIASGAFRIRGIFRTQNTPYDEANVFVYGKDLSELLGTPGEIHEIAVLLKSNAALDSTCQKLQSGWPSVKTETWKEIAPEIDLTVSVANQSFYIFMGIIMLALAFGIVNTMLMAILERTREIGMLMALGMNKAKVFYMIFLETLFLVFCGTPFGIILSLITTYYFGKYGIDMSGYKEVYSSFGYSEMIYPTINLRDYRIILELVVATTIFSSLFPARRALKLNPSEAIRK
ncbi:MAG TPA: FtsX-like permease family protein [Bacteroidia bacterium]|nr:FtsX-like permease family protein [Bacteroidia bacterium]